MDEEEQKYLRSQAVLQTIGIFAAALGFITILAAIFATAAGA